MEGVAQPSGTLTVVFTEVEGSARLLAQLGRDAYRDSATSTCRVRPRKTPLGLDEAVELALSE